MKIAIIGSRCFENNSKIDNIIESIIKCLDKEDILVSGGAKGVDLSAEYAAKESDIKCIIFKPDFKEGYNVKEYYRRNEKIIKEADVIISIWNKRSKGTLSSLKILLKEVEE
ncbi:MAG: SLOG family protein [Candidatus Nanoarchaeia archaeon]|jgi:predicted Rossmann fold nucleotide-binding protein DprA/Smf involved in DNA uptake